MDTAKHDSGEGLIKKNCTTTVGIATAKHYVV